MSSVLVFHAVFADHFSGLVARLVRCVFVSVCVFEVTFDLYIRDGGLP